MRASVLKEHVIRSCHYLIQPVVRFLLKHDVTWSEFGELSKDAYVAVAREDHGIQGRPTNNSRVAMLTGLSRREVARIRDRLLEGEIAADSLHGNRISQILSGWHTDREFSTDDGRPKDLPVSGSVGSLDALLRKYAGDLPHGAVRKELQQRGLAEELEGGNFRVLRRDYIYSKLDPEIIRRMGVALHDHAATLENNLDERPSATPRFEGVADNVKISPRVFEAFKDFLEERGSAFLEEVDTWLSQNEINESKDAGVRTVRLGVGVYSIYDESKQGSEK